MIFFWKDPVYLKIHKMLHGWIHPYRSLIIGGILMAFISGGVSSGVPILLKELIDKVFAQKDPQLLFILPLSFFVLFSVKGFTGFFQAYLLKKAALFMISDVRQSLFEHLIRMPLASFGKEGTGHLMSRVTNDTYILQGGVAEIIRDLLRNSFTAVGMLVALLYIDYKLTIFVLLAVPLTLIPIRKIGKKLRMVSRKTQESYADVNQHLSETLSAIRLIKSVGSEEKEIRQFREFSQAYAKSQFRSAKYENLLSPIMESIGALGIGLAVWLGGYSVIHGHLTLGTLVGFLTAAQMLYQPIKGLANSQAGIQQSLAAAERIAEVLERPLEEMNVARSGWTVSRLEKSLEFRNVSFRYPVSSSITLENISFVHPVRRFCGHCRSVRFRKKHSGQPDSVVLPSNGRGDPVGWKESSGCGYSIAPKCHRHGHPGCYPHESVGPGKSPLWTGPSSFSVGAGRSDKGCECFWIHFFSSGRV